jgi:site-specific recombinase XerD
MTPEPLQDLPSCDALQNHIEPFLDHLRVAGYAERTLRKKRCVLQALARWTKRKPMTVDSSHDDLMRAFLGRLPQKRKVRLQFERGVLQLFFEYLRSVAPVVNGPVPEDLSEADRLLRAYESYLRKDRGLTENSIHVYLPFIRVLLRSHDLTGNSGCDSFDTLAIREFLLRQTYHRSAEYRRLLSIALRSFFRFLFLSGRVRQELSPAVPTVRKYRQSTPPAFLSPEDIERVLTTTDRSTPTGRRDHAILLLLARLGLRAGEVVALELDDIRWRTGEIVIRGKGRIIDPLPLLSDVGEAIAAYLREARGVSASRRVFLRIWAPRVGLTGPAAVGHIVRRALRQAGVSRSGRGAAHLFRHGLGTRMIGHGASLAEISEVLRHRSPTSTAVYTQVSFDALRHLALPWPLAGGAQ